MIITLEKDSYHYFSNDNCFELECKGIGTKEDPLIINSSFNLPKSFEINESEYFIIIRDCKLTTLKISVSKNIKIENCLIERLVLDCSVDIVAVNNEIKWVELLMSQSCAIEKCKIFDNFYMENSLNCILKDNTIRERFDMEYCIDNLIKNCEIGLIIYYFENRRNIFKSNKIYSLKTSLKDTTADWIKDGINKFNPNQESNALFCSGTGSREDPFIIEKQKLFLKKIITRLSVHHVIYRNIDRFFLLDLAHCKNKTIDNCEIKKCYLIASTNIKLKNTHLKQLWISQSKGVLIENCVIEKVKTSKNSPNWDITFKNCVVNKIREASMKDLNFINTKIPKLKH